MHKTKFIAAVAFFVLAISVPITMSFLQQRQDNRSKASASTTLSFSPTTITKVVGDTVAVDVMINPGTNMVSYVKFDAKFDPGVIQLDSATPFIRNVDAFPSQVQNPVITNGSIKAAVSIGSDLSRPVRTPTKVGTLYFKVIGPTNSVSSQILFGDTTQILSISPTDNPSENVLSTTTPATVVVTTSSTPTPSISLSPTTTATPTATITTDPSATLSSTPTILPTGIGGGGPTATPSATVVPTTTPTPGIQVNLTVILHAIGIGGDNVNPTGNSFSNKNPIHASRSATVTLHSASDIVVSSGSGTINYSNPTGVFFGSIKISQVPSGYYTMKIKTDNHLSRRVPGIIAFNGQILTPPALQYVAGDATNDNKLNILDYNMMFGCYGPNHAVTCDDDKKVASDFNDDGQVNQVDYNLFLRELSQSFGD